MCPCSNCSCGANTLPEYSIEQRASRLEQLPVFRTNVAPSDEELIIISNSIVEEERFISAVDDRIASLESDLCDLDQQRVDAEQRLSKYKDVLHPIRRIPADLLEDIFLACLDRDWIIQQRNRRVSVGSGSSNLDVRVPPWTLAQVSMVWRHVALNIPQLWAHIRVNTGRICENSKKMLEEQIIRADSAPLSMALIAVGSGASNTHLISLLLSTAPRWRELFLTVASGSESLLRSLSEVKSHLRLLKVLNLRDVSGVGVPSNLFRDVPSLSTVIGDRHIHHQSFSETAVEYRSVIKQDLNTIFPIINRQNQLQKLDIALPTDNLYYQKSLDQRTPPVTTHPTVRTLIVAPPIVSANSLRSSYGEPDPMGVLRSLTLPSLEDLTLCGKIDLDGIKEFLGRSNATLSTLAITSHSMDHLQILQMFTLVPDLSSLSIDCPNIFCDPVLEALTTARQQPTSNQSFGLLPKIRRMIFVGDRGRAQGFVKCVKDVRVDVQVYFMDMPTM